MSYELDPLIVLAQNQGGIVITPTMICFSDTFFELDGLSDNIRLRNRALQKNSEGRQVRMPQIPILEHFTGSHQEKRDMSFRLAKFLNDDCYNSEIHTTPELKGYSMTYVQYGGIFATPLSKHELAPPSEDDPASDEEGAPADDLLYKELGTRMDGSYYHNVYGQTALIRLFTRQHPNLKLRSCDTRCCPLEDRPHSHAVAGFYRSNFEDQSLAPPLWSLDIVDHNRDQKEEAMELLQEKAYLSLLKEAKALGIKIKITKKDDDPAPPPDIPVREKGKKKTAKSRSSSTDSSSDSSDASSTKKKHTKTKKGKKSLFDNTSDSSSDSSSDSESESSGGDKRKKKKTKKSKKRSATSSDESSSGTESDTDSDSDDGRKGARKKTFVLDHKTFSRLAKVKHPLDAYDELCKMSAAQWNTLFAHQNFTHWKQVETVLKDKTSTGLKKSRENYKKNLSDFRTKILKKKPTSTKEVMQILKRVVSHLNGPDRKAAFLYVMNRITSDMELSLRKGVYTFV
jgi:hypothetical protein